ncbi:hypothetical protein AcV7_009849 [Taiwanofungus camphoratus]|nr:hypothetical protein AcV7_009849 [Antrodia cinnamomea]
MHRNEWRSIQCQPEHSTAPAKFGSPASQSTAATAASFTYSLHTLRSSACTDFRYLPFDSRFTLPVILTSIQTRTSERQVMFCCARWVHLEIIVLARRVTGGQSSILVLAANSSGLALYWRACNRHVDIHGLLELTALQTSQPGLSNPNRCESPVCLAIPESGPQNHRGIILEAPRPTI